MDSATQANLCFWAIILLVLGANKRPFLLTMARCADASSLCRHSGLFLCCPKCPWQTVENCIQIRTQMDMLVELSNSGQPLLLGNYSSCAGCKQEALPSDYWLDVLKLHHFAGIQPSSSAVPSALGRLWKTASRLELKWTCMLVGLSNSCRPTPASGQLFFLCWVQTRGPSF